MASTANKSNRSKLKSVVVAWRDHHDVKKAWFDAEDIPSDGALIITQGFVADEDEKRYLIARDYSFDSEKVFGGGINILKGTVVKVWELGTIDRDDSAIEPD